MSGDYTRFTFDPDKVFSGVHKQQGRVSLDADFNEFEEILDRRDRSTTYDTFGQAVVPETTKDGFAIGVNTVTNELTIGIGRAYVDGIGAECFGDMSDPQATVYDPAMGNLVGSGPLAFSKQPFFYPGTTPPFPGPVTGINLLYLDVWQREVTSWEDARLLDPALGGPDTATRIQTAWQVKALPDATADSCTNPPAAWLAAIAPSTARITATASGVPPAPGPCVIQPAGGYTGLENRLYRVEIHKAGTLGGGSPATFTWSRDNASLVASVLGIKKTAATSIITVESTGRDSWMRFEAGQEIELLDDAFELALRESGQGGPIATITQVNHATGEISIDTDLSGFVIAADRHPRIRRWDSSAVAPAAERPVANGVAFQLEEGISVSWGDGTPAHDGDTLHAGDWWAFAARTADGSIQTVDDEPPRGNLHHYMKLAVVTAGTPSTMDDDCRVIWPPSCDSGCGCDACVTLESHLSGALTVQDAVNQVIAAGGGTVCIGIGTFPLGDQPVDISNAMSVQVRGSGIATILEFTGVGPAIRVDTAVDIGIRDLAVVTQRDGSAAQNAIEISNAGLVALERLTVVEDPLAVLAFLDTGADGKPVGGAVALAGFVLQAGIRECVLAGGGGVVARAWTSGDAGDYLLAADLVIEHDLVFGISLGIGLGSPGLPGAVILADRTAIRSCSIYGCENTGLQLSATVVAGDVLVEDNTIGSLGTGMSLSADRVSVAENAVSSWNRNKRASGIAIVRGDSDRVSDVRLSGNRVDGFGLSGIEVDAFVVDLAVTGNTVADCANGIVMTVESRGDGVSIIGNVVNDIGTEGGADDSPVFGIALFATADGQVLDNTIRRIAVTDPKSQWRAGIQAVACLSTRVAGNTVTDIGPTEFASISVGIGSTAVFERLDVNDNAVQPGQESVFGRWYALLVGGDDPWGKWLVTVGGSAWWVGGGWVAKAASRDVPSQAAVRGNHLDAVGKTPTVLVVTGGSCTFSDNYCRQPIPNGEPVVVIGTEKMPGVLALATNQVRQRAPNGSVAIDAWVLPTTEPKPPALALTALGNITDGIIRVNGAVIPAPWRPLNVRLS